MSEKSYEQKYNELMSHLDKMHKRNIQKTRAALRSFLIIPTVFLILVFLTNSNKTVFLVLWIASLFAIAAVLIVTEYQDYSIRRIVQSVLGDSDVKEKAEEPPAEPKAEGCSKEAPIKPTAPIPEASPEESTHEVGTTL